MYLIIRNHIGFISAVQSLYSQHECMHMVTYTNYSPAYTLTLILKDFMSGIGSDLSILIIYFVIHDMRIVHRQPSVGCVGRCLATNALNLKQWAEDMITDY